MSHEAIENSMINDLDANEDMTRMDDNKTKAIALANALSAYACTKAEAVHVGGNIWTVKVKRNDGSLVVFADDAVLEYDSEERYNDGIETTVVLMNFAD